MSRKVQYTGLLIVAVALIGSLAPAAPEAGAPNKALVKEQLALIEKAEADLDQLHDKESLSLADPRFSIWGRRKLEALRASGAGKLVMVDAAQSYLNRMRLGAAFAKKAFENGQISRVDASEAEYRRLEAELWLMQERGEK